MHRLQAYLHVHQLKQPTNDSAASETKSGRHGQSRHAASDTGTRCWKHTGTSVASLVIGCALAACGGGSRGGTVPVSAIIAGNSPSGSAGSSSATPISSANGTADTLNPDTGTNGGSSTRSDIPTDHGFGVNTNVSAAAVGVPAPASFGAAVPPQIATPGGQSFDGSSGGFASSVSFPAATSTLKFPSKWDYGTDISAINTSEGAVVTVNGTSATSTFLQIVIPALGIDRTIDFDQNLVKNEKGATWGVSYVALGAWAQYQGQSPSVSQFESLTEFLFGYETPASSVPTIGQATFSGYAEANIIAPVSPGGPVSILSKLATGNADLRADFASHTIIGAFTRMQYFQNTIAGPASVPWNDVSVTASIVTGTNRFSGSTAVTSTPEGTFSLKASATGHIDGAFYGPNAENLGAIWSLSDGTASVIGGVAARR
jgi:hypothetical protein